MIGVLVAFAGLGLQAFASGGRPAIRPGWDATSDQISALLSKPVSGFAFVSNGLASIAFLLLTVFFVRLLLNVWQAGRAPGWLPVSAGVGASVYIVLELGRVVLTSARGFAPGHHFSSAEAATLFDLSNALTTVVWGAIGMMLIPLGLALIYTVAVGRWLGGAAILIGLASLGYAFVAPVGASTPAELAFLGWIVVVSVLLTWRPGLLSAPVS